MWLGIIIILVFILGIKFGVYLICSDLLQHNKISMNEYYIYKSFSKLWDIFRNQ